MVAFITIFSIFNIFIVIIPESSNALMIRCNELSWVEGSDVQEAVVSPGSTGNVSFIGIARFYFAIFNETEEAKYFLFANSDQGWKTVVEPNEITLTPEQNYQRFYVNVTVPTGTSFYTSDTLRVYANTIIYPGNHTDLINEITASIKVKQFYGLRVSPHISSKQIKKGDKAFYNLSISNTGNAADTIIISVTNLDEVKDSGLEIIVPEQLEIEYNETKFIELLVKTSKNTKSGNYQIKLSVRSDQEERNNGFAVPYNLTLTLEVEPDLFISMLSNGVILIALVFLGLVSWIKRQKKIALLNHSN